MSTEGAAVITLMGQMRGLFRETALLLKTADDYMKSARWKLRSNQCVTLRTVPEDPAYWFPEYAFRFYVSEHHRSILAFLSAIFDDRSDNGRIVEPLLTGGWHDFGAGSDAAVEQYNANYASWHPHMPDRRDDGTLISVDPRQKWPEDKYKIIRTTTMAVPLVEITKPDDLKTRVIDPLLLGIRGAAS